MLSRRDRVLAWAMPVVLVAVALHQVHLAVTRDLTPWKGGGFGMFASVDRSTWRPMQGVFVTDTGDRIPFAVHDLSTGSPRENRAFVNARALLDERRAAALFDVVESSEWVIAGGIAEYEGRAAGETPGPVVRRGAAEVSGDPNEAGEPSEHVTVTAIHLEVWRATYDRGTRSFVPVSAGRVERELGPSP